MARAEALEAYRALPIPDTTEEHWRFTDLKGFDPEAYGSQAGTLPRNESVTTMLDLDVAGYATVTRERDRHLAAARGRALRAAARGLRAAVLARRLEREVRRAQRGDVEERPARRRAEGPRAREAALRAHRGDGTDVLAPRRRRRGRRASIADRGVRVARARHGGVLERGHGALRRGEREARVRVAPEPLDGDLALRVASRARRARRRARLGRRRLRLEARQDTHPERPERPRRDLARNRRVLRRRHAASRLRHVPGAHRAELRDRTSRSRARCATTRPPSGAA